MPSVFPIIALMLALLPPPLPAQDPLCGDEVLHLVKIGVSGPEIAACAARRGGLVAVGPDTLEMARALGAAPETLNLLAAASDAGKRRVRLARDYQVRDLPRAGARILVPRNPQGYEMILEEDGARSLAVLRPLDAGPDWIASPGLFLMILRETPFPRASEDLLDDVLSGVLSRRLARFRPEPSRERSGRGILGDRHVPEQRLELTDPSRAFRGVLVMRCGIWPGGLVVLAGYGCGQSAEAEVRPLFEDLCRTLEIPGLSSRVLPAPLPWAAAPAGR